MQHRRSRTLVGVAVSSLAVLLLVAFLLPAAVGAAEPATTAAAEMPEPTTACGLDVVVILDDDTMLDDSAAPQALDALRALTSAWHGTPGSVTVADVSTLAEAAPEPARPRLVVQVIARDLQETEPDLPSSQVLYIGVRTPRDPIAPGTAVDGAGADEAAVDVYDGTGTFDLMTLDVYRTADLAPLEEAVRTVAAAPCMMPPAPTPDEPAPAPTPGTVSAAESTPAAVEAPDAMPMVQPVVAPAPVAAIDVEQLVNGDDADVTPGVATMVDDRITWTYLVTNRGNDPLRDVVVTDSNGLQPTLVGGDDGDLQLAPSETWAYRAESAAVAGTQRSVATVTARDSFESRVRDDDASHYTGTKRAFIGDTVWNDTDANAAPSPSEPGVPDARVVITNRDTGDRQTVTSDATGAYRAAVEPGDYAVTLDMESVDGELTTPEAFEFSVDEGETYLGADFGLDEFDVSEPLPFTGSTTSNALRFGLVAVLAGAVLLGLVRLTYRHAGVRR